MGGSVEGGQCFMSHGPLGDEALNTSCLLCWLLKDIIIYIYIYSHIYVWNDLFILIVIRIVDVGI